MHRSSYCGVNCEKCGAYTATAACDDSLRERVAAEWSRLYDGAFVRLYGRPLDKGDIVCFGCKSNKVFVLCAKCDIRPCNTEKGIENCEDCGGFPCARLERFFAFHRENETGNVFD